MSKSSLSQTRRAMEQDMVQRLTPHHGSLHIDIKLLNNLLLSMKRGKILRPYLIIKVLVLNLRLLPRIVILNSHSEIVSTHKFKQTINNYHFYFFKKNL